MAMNTKSSGANGAWTGVVTVGANTTDAELRRIERDLRALYPGKTIVVNRGVLRW